MESGEVVVNSWLHVLNLMLNRQQGSNDLEFVRDGVPHFYEVSPHFGKLEIR